MYLAEDIFAKFKGFGHPKVDFNETGVDKGPVINIFHGGREIHLLDDGAVKCSFAYTLEPMRHVDFLQSPATSKGSVRYLRDALGQDNGGELLACTESIGSNNGGVARQTELSFLAWRTNEQHLLVLCVKSTILGGEMRIVWMNFYRGQFEAMVKDISPY